VKALVAIIILITSPYLSIDEQKRIDRRARMIIRKDLGVKILPRYLEKEDACPLGDSTNEAFIQRWYCYDSQGFTNSGFTMVLTTPAVTPQGRFMGGLAAPICSRIGNSGLAYATIQANNDIGENRWRHSILGVAHEFGHLLGATHDDTSSNIMHPDAYRHLSKSYRLKFSKKSKKEVLSCLRGVETLFVKP